jgi:hypothetical protein
MAEQEKLPEDTKKNHVGTTPFILRWKEMDAIERSRLYEEACILQSELEVQYTNTSPSTSKEYLKIMKRFSAKKTVVIKSSSTLRTFRSAFLYRAAHNIIKTPKNKHIDLCKNVEFYLLLVKYIESPTEHQEGQQCEDQAFSRICNFIARYGYKTIGPDRSSFPVRKGRISKLKQYPIDWRERVLNAVNTKIEGLKEAVLVIAHLGCRPCEVPSAAVTVVGDILQITVKSAKALGGKDPKVRGAIYPISELNKLIAELAKNNANPFSEIDIKQISNILQRSGQKKDVFPKLQRVSVTCSDFRNQIASDCKAAGYTGEKLALLLGHITNEQQKVYGRSRYGNPSSPFLPTQVLLSHEVREIQSKYQSRPFSDHDDDDDASRESSIPN